MLYYRCNKEAGKLIKNLKADSLYHSNCHSMRHANISTHEPKHERH